MFYQKNENLKAAFDTKIMNSAQTEGFRRRIVRLIFSTEMNGTFTKPESVASGMLGILSGEEELHVAIVASSVYITIDLDDTNPHLIH
jgi:hypothetical protein